VGGQRGGHLTRGGCVAHANGRAHQRHQPVTGERPQEVFELGGATEQLRRAARQAGGACGRRVRRRRPSVGGGHRRDVVLQDRRLELANLRGRVDAELVGDVPVMALVDVQRGAAGRVQRPHQDRDRPLPQRMRGCQVTGPCDRLVERAPPQEKRGAVLQRCDVQFLETGCDRTGERVRELTERGAAPQPSASSNRSAARAGSSSARARRHRASNRPASSASSATSSR